MINYLYTSPIPKIQGTDAVVNEIHSLKSSFGGKVESLYPFKTPNSKYPRFMFGLHSLKKILAAEKKSKYNHIFASGLFYMPIVHLLKKPIIYSLTAGINENSKIPSKEYLSKFKSIVVSNERDFSFLTGMDLKNIKLIRTGIDTSKFEESKKPIKKSLNLLMASAPWEMSQFESKGIHLLLEMIKSNQELNLIFLWRNILPQHMKVLIKEYGLEDKVKFVNRFVDTNKYFKKVHGTILLCNDSRIVKAYPHSIIESLITSKPVIVSKEIPMADFIDKNNCGVVLQKFNKEELQLAIDDFMSNYKQYVSACSELQKNSFSQKRLIEDYRNLYRNVFAY